MTKNAVFFILVFALAVLNMGVIRRNEDPIRDTQTSPILYKQKMEEEKDGKKGPLSYTMKYNPPDTFMTGSPVSAETGQETFEKAATEKSAGAEWWEEAPAEPSAAAPDINPEAAPKTTGEGSENAASAQGSQEENWW